MKEEKPRPKTRRIQGMDLTSRALVPYTDDLTKAYNRAFLLQLFPQRLKRAELNNYKICVFMIDLDNFKHVNDTYGHLTGDKVLRGVADNLHESLRKDDYLIRYAGDEFLAIAEDIDLEVAYTLAERLMSSVRNFKLTFKDKTITQTASIGFALFPDDARSLEELIEHADEALYLAKKRNKDNFAHFQEVNINQISVKAGMNSFPCHTFIDREKEFALIQRSIEEVHTRSTARGVIVYGESGIGKSRILKESSIFAQQLGMEALSFIPHQKNSLTPYFLLSKTFNAHITHNLVHNKKETTNLLQEMERDKIEVLSHFLSCLSESFPPKGARPLDAPHIFDAFFYLIEKLALKKNGLFLSVDNIHYIDLTSLRFFDFLLGKAPQIKLFFLITILDPLAVDVYNPSELSGIIASMGSRANTDVIGLGYFSEAETVQMINAIFPGIGETADLSKTIFEITKGHPFFIGEFLKYLLEKSIIYFENERWQIKRIKKESLPHSLDEVLRERLEGLDPEVKETVLISSVIGEEINPEVLGKIRSINEGDVLEILNKAKKMKIIKDEEGGFSFLNVVAKEAALNEVPYSQKKGIYGKVSEALMDIYKDNIETVSFQLANLFNKVEDVEKLNVFSKMLTKRASEIFNPDEVLRYLEDLSQIEKEEEVIATAPEIQDAQMDLAVEFLRLFHGAFKDFKLYPQGSKIRISVVDNTYNALKSLFANYSVINVSEVEKSLVVNKRRITPQLARFLDVDDIVRFLIDRDVKSIIFFEGISKEEIRKFFETIVLDAKDIYKQGTWKDILTKQNLAHVSVNKATYVLPHRRGTSHPLRDKLEGAMISDFILSKISGKDSKNIDITSILGENPELLSQELLKAAQIAKKLDQHTDKLNVLFQGMRSLDEFAQESAKDSQDPNKITDVFHDKIADAFKNFDAKTKAHLIRKSSAHDQPMMTIIHSLDEEYMGSFLRDVCASGLSLWGLGKLISKLVRAYKYPQKKIEDALKRNVVAHLKCEEEKKFLLGEVKWEGLPFDSKITDMVKLDEEDLGEVPLNEMSYALERLIISENYNKFQELFISLREKCLEFPQKIAEKVKSIYVKGFKNVYFIVDEKKKIFPALRYLLLTIQQRPSKEVFDFSLGLIKAIIEELNLHRFVEREDIDKIQIFYEIGRAIEEHKSYIGEEGVSAWHKKINFQKIATDIFHLYIRDPVISQKIASMKEAFYNLLLFSLEQVMANLSERLLKVSDPFERFVAFNKLQDFFLTLKGESLEQFITTVMDFFEIDDICGILVSARTDKLAMLLKKVYLNTNTASREKVLGVIEKLNLEEALPFLKTLMQQEPNSLLQKKALRAYKKIKEER
ncbi:MAG: diguanylate cyclase [Candidatus Omnitrophota bacterium]|nr:MAG: diguanylate cyclase [Candidatus Omnitrophota bacterium]